MSKEEMLYFFGLDVDIVDDIYFVRRMVDSRKFMDIYQKVAPERHKSNVEKMRSIIGNHHTDDEIISSIAQSIRCEIKLSNFKLTKGDVIIINSYLRKHKLKSIIHDNS